MARASSRLPALFLLSCFCSMSSIHVRFAASLSLQLPFSRPTTILVFPGAASVGGSSTGRVSSYAKEVLPLWGNHTGGMADLTTNFSFHITPYPSGSWLLSAFGSMNSSVRELVESNSTTNWNGDCCYVAVEFNTCFNQERDARYSALIGMDVSSTEYAERTSPSKKNLSSVLLQLPPVSYLASHAAGRSFDYEFSLGINTTVFCLDYDHFIIRVLLAKFDAAVCDITIPSKGSKLPYEPKTRRLLPGSKKNARRATRKKHAAIRGKVTPSWLEQAAVAGSALVGFICAVAGLALCCIRSKRPRPKPASIELEDDEHIIVQPELRRGLGPSEFGYSELAAATDNFAEERKIGRGGFGPVYRGYLTDQDRHVAIKVLSQEQSVQGLKEFQAEVTIMSQLRHRNIVKLVGWCGRRGRLALVYELMPGGSLDTHLYSPDRHLTWRQRYKIALQLGSALRYLHTDCDQCVVHGDIKPANVMLDASGNAKLGDFGLARLVDHGAEPQTTQVVAGTVGYIDPEFVSSRRPSTESDVYSFGVVLLEIACGRRPASVRRPGQAASAALLASVRDMYRRNVIIDAADRRLECEFDEMQMERLLVTGLWCAHQDPLQRPSVDQAVDVLRSEDAQLPALGAMGGSDEDISALEGQAYGDLSAENSAYLDASNETAYLTT